MKYILPFYHLYLLQLENYDLVRYIKFIYKTYSLPKSNLRKSIIWTQKLTLIFCLSIVIVFLVGLTFQHGAVGFLTAILIFIFFPWLFYIISTIVLYPLDYILKKIIIRDAKNKIKHFPNLQIVAVAGSFGKTTTKEILITLLSQKYKTVGTQDNLNTPLGIAKVIKNKITKATEIFVVEMGEYIRGDVKDITYITPPDYVFVTGINEAHLERMGNFSNTIQAIFEVVENSKLSSEIFLNDEDDIVKDNYKKYINNRKMHFYSRNTTSSNYYVKQKKFLENGDGILITLYKNKKPLRDILIPFLGSYIIATLNGVLALCSTLSLSEKEIASGISQIKSIPHRLQRVPSTNGVLVIDDSYNGNFDGVKEAISLLSQFKNKRKIYITPGLVELGSKNKDIHIQIGRLLSQVADKVILIKNSATIHIQTGLLDNGFAQDNIIWYNSSTTAHAGLGEILQKNDVVIFQNDWPDNYV